MSAAARTLSLIDLCDLSDDAAHKMLCGMRWPDIDGAPICPHCSCAAVYAYRCRRLFKCKACHRQFCGTSLANDVVRAILPAVANAERQRAMRKAPESLSAWEAWQRALWHWSGGDLTNSRNFLERAVALDPSFAPPHAMMAWLYLSEATIGVGPPLGQMLDQALSAARTAIQLDHNSAIAHAMLAWVLDHQGNSGSALEEAETAINLNPNDPQGHLIKGHVLMLSGRPDAAREPLNTALRLDPRGPIAAVVMLKLTTCSYFERDYETADAAGRRVIRAWPNFPRPYLVHAAVLGQLGRADEARKALDAAIAASPSYFKNHTSRCPPYFRPMDHEHLLDGLRKAGWRCDGS